MGLNSINTIMVNNSIIINNVNIKMCTIWLDVCLTKQEMPTGAKGHADFIICSAAKSELNQDYFWGGNFEKIILKRGNYVKIWHFSADVSHHLARGYIELKSENFSNNAHFDCL